MDNLRILSIISFSFTIFVLFYFLSLCDKRDKFKIILVINIILIFINNIYGFSIVDDVNEFMIHTFLLNYIVLFINLILFNKKQQKLITKDFLTGLNNRFSLYKYLDEIKDENIYLIIGDINKFKKINDDHGHDEGDKILKVVSEALKSVGKNNNKLFISRYGGDEFVFVYSTYDENQVKKIIKELDCSVQAKCYETGYDISMSFGYSEYDKSDFKKSFKEADKNMYEVKKGKGI